MKSVNNNVRIVNNTLFLYARTIVVLLVSLYTARILLKELGVVDYGVYNIVGSVVVLFSFLNTAMTQSSQRFITFELGRGDNTRQLDKVFSMSVNTQIIIMLFIVFLSETIGLWFLNYKLVIPAGREFAANVAYQLSIFTFATNVIRVPFNALVIAYEKMSFFAYISMIDSILKMLIVVFLFSIDSDKLIIYCILLLIVTISVFFIYLYYSFKALPRCKYIRIWDNKLFKELFSFSGWSLCGSAADVFTQKGFMFILNIFIGVAANAAMGIGNQVAGALRNFISSFQTSFTPQIIKSYANQDYARFHDLIIETSKLSYIIMILPILFLYVNMPLLLKIWLGEVPLYAIEFCRILTLCAAFDAFTGPFYYGILSSKKIRNYQIMISIVFISDLIISYLLAINEVTPYYILYSRLFTRGVVNMIIGIAFLKNKFQFPVNMYGKKVLFPLFFGTTLLVLGLIPINNYTTGLLTLSISIVYISLMGFAIIANIMLDQRERTFIKKMISNLFAR